MKVFVTALLCLVIASAHISAQEITQKDIEREYVKADDNMRFDYYEKATPALHWLLKNAPSFNRNVQKYAVEAFENLALKTENESKKRVLLDSMLIAYESKEEHFGLSDLDKNKLAFRYFKYFRDDKSKLADAFAMYKEVYESPTSVINNNLVTYIYMAQRYDKHVANLSQEEILHVYNGIANVIGRKKVMDESTAKFDKYLSQVDDVLVRMTAESMNCEIIEKLANGLNRADSVKVSKRVMGLSLDVKCGRTASFEEALDILSRNEPTPGIFKVLAQSEAAAKNYEDAISLYKKAFDLETDNVKKSSIQLNIAQLYQLNMNKPAAREYALSAISLDDAKGPAAYTLIGHLYANSYNECSESDDDVENRAVYFAAYDMFEKAKNQSMMKEISLQFPTTGSAFSEGHYENDTIEVGCWINIETKVRTRSNN
ncbi:tetratricopeptide repeat protein [Roseivirga misakiensis]|uniref:Tetratricopeptide repeat protein n=1 Tax=Roseivirga misakiensis TaxID=1563681 RepID=A0A1E5SYI2_9BACT|nr:hypothetical protein [Roseivirga misakiensis]OEK04193.1 hypothetical protein BFP71_11965 [Roseivirga misakiensis]